MTYNIPEESLCRGLNKGFKVTKRTPIKKLSKKKKVSRERRMFVHDLIREVCGFSPYERRIIELLKMSCDKRALRCAKKKLGTHHRALRKREELQSLLQKK